MTAPAIQLLPYQQDYLRAGEESRVVLVEKARQTGFSFVAGLEAVLDASSRLTRWFVLSRSERQSKEFMEEVARHARALQLVAEMWESDARPSEPQVLECRFANGSKIVGLPANANTARGISGNLILDEFAFHEDPDAIWRGAFPAITRGHKLRVISTPNGKQNRYYRLMHGDLGEKLAGTARRFRVDIHDAVKQGLNVDLDMLREAAGDLDSWRQEYELVYLDDTEQPVLPYELLLAAEHPTASASLPVGFAAVGPLFLGVDIGRKKDLTVFWVDEQIAGLSWTRAVIEMRGAKFSEQREQLYRLLQLPKMTGCCIDQTGLGMQLAEEAVDAFGDLLVKPVTFTMDTKTEMVTRVRRRFEERLARIPVSHAIREDLHSVCRVPSASGAVRFLAERSADGHADRFWAKALAELAATNEGEPHIYAVRMTGTEDRRDLRRAIGWA